MVPTDEILSSSTEDTYQTFLALQNQSSIDSAAFKAEEAKRLRQANSVQDHMYEDCQQLLQLFGIPYVVNPMEAEAQCAFFDSDNGTITDDSDVWLFGGKRVYKNFFAKKKYVEFYKDVEIMSHFGLSRKKLINFALLTGSDHTAGIDGVGLVTALEILSEFEDDGIEALVKFKEWWEAAKKHSSPPKNNIRSKLQKLPLSAGFPNKRVFDAYVDPTVDNSKDIFSWGRPDLDALRDYTREKFGWNKNKVDNILLPVIRRLNEKSAQTHLDSFFSVNLRKEKELFPSKRVMSALRKINSPSNKSGKKNDAKGSKGSQNKKTKSGVRTLNRRGSNKKSSSDSKLRVSDKTTFKRNIVKDYVTLSEESSNDETEN